MNTRFRLLPAALATAIITACGGGPNETSVINNTPSTNTPTNSGIRLELGETAQVNEGTIITITPGEISSSSEITTYDWVQLANGSQTIDFTQDGASITFTAPNVREDTNLSFALTVTNAAGGSQSDSIIVQLIADTVTLAGKPLALSHPPAVGDDLIISVPSTDKLGPLTWELISAPADSGLSAAINETGKFIVMENLPLAGSYTVQATSQFDGSSITATFEATDKVTIDPTAVRESESFGASLNIVQNQAWVSSSSLSLEALRTLVEGVNALNIREENPNLGVLVEFDHTSGTALDSLEQLLLTPGVDGVAYRLQEDRALPRDEFTPNDFGSSGDQGGNWHLEAIDITDAWDVTTGSSDIAIGITDSGFNIEHEDLVGRVVQMYTDQASDHGTMAVSTIGANTNNGIGVAGINGVSPLVLADSSLEDMEALLGMDNIKVMNNAWAIPGLISEEFDPLDSATASAQFDFAVDMTRAYRSLSQYHEDVLFVWPAGNGIANGVGNTNQVYGIDGRSHSPALHYDDKGAFRPSANVVFAAAHLPDGRLAYYSNYGKAVDIAAPTSFQTAISIDEYHDDSNQFGDGLSGYAGTSASASVVSGVASLVYSINPNFTGEQVKEILRDSATTFVTERYISPFTSDVETLDTPIPVVNANLAVSLAQERADALVDTQLVITDPLTRTMTVNTEATASGYSVISVSWELMSSADGESNWMTLANDVSDSASFDVELDTENSHHQIVLATSLTTPAGNTVVAEKTLNTSYASVTIRAVETVGLLPVSGVALSFDQFEGANIAGTTTTGDTGQATVFMLEGSYKMNGERENYADSATRFNLNGQANQDLLIVLNRDNPTPGIEDGAFDPNNIDETGALSGFVTDASGAPIQAAIVRISGGDQTNGFFASTLTDENGYYSLTNLSQNDSTGMDILEFFVEVSLDDFASSIRSGVRILDGQDATENFVLLQQRPFTTLFADDFENGRSGWQLGFTEGLDNYWNLFNLAENEVANFSVDNGNTSLAPDEIGPRALLPQAASGEYAWWYGQESTGSFIGTSVSATGVLDGGTSSPGPEGGSDADNEGTLTSISLDLSQTSLPFLRFKTWWEIESINPNSQGFDRMHVQISRDGGETFEDIKILNPFVDPNDEDRDHKPFSSGGFNRKPIWVIEEFDLSEYKGASDVQIRFFFFTRDTQYNGFRGWLIDDFLVGDYIVNN